MKPVIFALLAMVCYAISNVLLELKFSKYNTFTIMICYLSIVVTFAIIGRQVTLTDDPSFKFPTGSALMWMIVLGLVFTAADYFYIGAYTNGGSLMTITGIVVMFPVFASIVKFAVNRDLPNGWQVAGYALAVCAVALVTKGSMVK